MIRALRELSYKGGNTRTGAAILHVADRVFLPRLARPGVPKVTSPPGPRAPASGLRPPCLTPPPTQVCILITDGKSQDLVDSAAQRLKGQGVKLFAVGESRPGGRGRLGRARRGGWQLSPDGLSPGIKNADPEELRRVASQPTSDFFFFVNDFSILRTLLPLVSRRVCTTAGGVPVTLPRESLPAACPAGPPTPAPPCVLWPQTQGAAF